MYKEEFEYGTKDTKMKNSELLVDADQELDFFDQKYLRQKQSDKKQITNLEVHQEDQGDQIEDEENQQNKFDYFDIDDDQMQGQRKQEYELDSPLKISNNGIQDMSRGNQLSLMMDSIKQSYKILASPELSAIAKKKIPMRTLYQKSFMLPSNENGDENLQGESKAKQMKEILLQNLKAPLNIDLNDLNRSKKHTKLAELGKDLYVFREKSWQKANVQISTEFQELIINSFQISFSTINKIKIFAPKPLEEFNEVKIGYIKGKSQGKQIFLNMKSEKQIKKVPYQFLLFVEILAQKLKFEDLYQQTKWEKKQHICEDIIFGSYIFGEIYKMSQNFRKWQKRYIVINNKGIFSYLSGNKKQEHSFFIEKHAIQYIWTRCELVDSYLIVKVKHGLMKTEFGIPLVNFSYPHHKNWLFYFFKLMMPKK